MFNKKIDFKNPVTILLMALAILLPIVGGFYMQTGMVFGILESLTILVLIKKMPEWAQNLVAKHPFAADLLFSVLATWGLSALYGHGLVIAIAAVTCAAILSWALPTTKPP